jgi:ribosomal protein S18 acetylase RimI-like enzyme
MQVGEVLELQRRGLEAWFRVMASASAGAGVIERDGVVGAVIPACPQRSIVNSVAFRDAEALAAALGGLATAYEAAGVRAWTVWVPEDDREAISLLETHGHRCDGEPAAMYLDLERMAEPDPGDLDWDAEAEAAELGRINDAAYGFAPGEGFGPAIGEGRPPASARLYRARVDGEAVCGLQAIDVGEDCVITMVATLEQHRGRGIAGRLLSAALAEARERGLRTSTLQSSMLGRGVYERLGYSVATRLQLHERRQ